MTPSKPSIHGRAYEQTRHGPLLRPCAPHSVLSRMGDKWTILVLSHLAVSERRRLRFSELKSGLDGITQRMLTLTLRNLERDGLVTRQVFPEVPPRVEYALTEMGTGLLPALEGFTEWIRENWPRMEANRRVYDERAPSSLDVRHSDRPGVQNVDEEHTEHRRPKPSSREGLTSANKRSAGRTQR